MVTVYELLCGAEKAQYPTREREKIERFVSAIIELPFDRAAAESAARVRMELERAGTPIGPYDLLIAGQALGDKLILVTDNTREFKRVSGLQVESWQ